MYLKCDIFGSLTALRQVQYNVVPAQYGGLHSNSLKQQHEG